VTSTAMRHTVIRMWRPYRQAGRRS
jgi:hypothetical protein